MKIAYFGTKFFPTPLLEKVYYMFRKAGVEIEINEKEIENSLPMKEPDFLIKEYNKITQEVGEKLNTTVIEIELPEEAFFPYDVDHPNELGHQMIAEKLFNYLFK